MTNRAPLASHHQHLLDASGITAPVAAARGYRTITADGELAALGFCRSQRLGSGLLIPIYGVDGKLRTHQYRPDRPRLDAKGKPRKYECPWRSPSVVDVPRPIHRAIADPKIALWITEGARKADAAVSVGLTCISLGGVWSWRGRNAHDGKTALPDWELVALNGRLVYLCFDSDVMTKPEVASALRRLTGFLEYRQAKVRPVYLPSGADGAKVGLDDFLAAHGHAALLELAAKPAARSGFSGGPATAPRPSYAPCTLAELEAVFKCWIPTNDLIPTRAMLAAYVANRRLAGDPVWMLLVGGSGSGKTERLSPLAVMPDVILESSITGPSALLSGTAQKERAMDATGGLLRKLPADGAVLILKDFTSIIDMHRDARAELLAALREVYDGRWDRSVGAEGGKTMTWTGRVGLIAGCTTAIDSAHAVMATMGMRFVLVRLERNPRIAHAAFEHVGGERSMRAALKAAVGGLLDHLPGRAFDKADARKGLIALGSYVALARSPIDRDGRHEIRLVLDAEAPTRVLKMLVQLWQACGLLGLSHEEAWAVVRRVAFDSVPKLRRAVLDHLAQSARLYTTTEVAEAVERPTQTTRRALEDLAAHRVIYREAGGPGKADLWALAKQTRTWLKRVAATFPVLSGGVEPDRTDVSNDADSPTGSTVPDKTGKVSVDEPAPPKGKGTRPANGRF